MAGRGGRAAQLGLAAVGTVLAVGAGEGAVRLVDPAPRVLVVRPDRADERGLGAFDVRGGHVVWTHPGSERRQDPGCGPEARNVLLLGSSILWGTGYGPDEVVSAYLQEALDPTRQAVCVRNHAQPAYMGGNKAAELDALAPALAPAVVVWEVWTSDPASFTLIDGVAYDLSRSTVDADGYPVLLPFLPSGLHHALFRHSRLWWYAHLTLAQAPSDRYDEVWREHLEVRLPHVLGVAREHGELLLVFVSRLDTPFDSYFEEQERERRGYWWTREWALAEGVPFVDVAERWGKDVDVEAVRHDPCCHLNPEGHRRLAALLAPEIRRVLEQPAPP